MLHTFKRLALGLLLIAVSASILLLSDRKHRRTSPEKLIPQVALVQFSSRPVLEDTLRGVTDVLRERGYREGETVHFKRFNPENDQPTLATIARSIAGGEFKMVITASTPALQAMAAANTQGRVIHVFGTVTDPFSAGVGINRTNSFDRPKHLAGVGTFQPVKDVFRLVKKIHPSLKRVGVVWCTSEACSEACLRLARDVCRELDIELMEAPVENSTGVSEAADALVSRDVEAIWIGGDNIVETAAASVVHAAQKGRIPVFANAAGHIDAGAFLGLGANYYDVGRAEGVMAADILDGKDPASFAVDNVVPPFLALNLMALEKVRDPWRIPPDILASADSVLDHQGRHARKVASPQPAPSAQKQYTIGLVYFCPDESADTAMQGLLDGLRAEGLTEGENLQVRRFHAQGELSNIPPILQALDGADVDVIVTFTTPVLTAACGMIKRKPVVCTYTTDPLAAGAGKSQTNHLPFVTGAGCFPPLEDTVEFIKKMFPNLKRLGTLYNSSEANSVKVVSVLRTLCQQQQIILEEVTIPNSSEILPAVDALIMRDADVIYLPGDNTAYQGLSALAKAAREKKIPLIIDSPELVSKGALAGIGLGYYATGKGTAPILARVLRGANPSDIPLTNISVKAIMLNPDVARALKYTFPPEIVEQARLFPFKNASGPQELKKQGRD